MMKNTLYATFLIVLFVSCSSQNDSTSLESTDFKSVSIEKSSTLMDIDTYWSMVSNSLSNTNSQKDQLTFLTEKLEKLSDEEIMGFHLRTNQLVLDSYTSELWCAAYIINGGCSDDGFEYFRRGLISLGKEVYTEALKHPDYLINVNLANGNSFELEDYSWVTINAFKNKTGEDIYEYIDYESFYNAIGKSPDIVFNWQEDDLESMKTICPKLYAKYWK